MALHMSFCICVCLWVCAYSLCTVCMHMRHCVGTLWVSVCMGFHHVFAGVFVFVFLDGSQLFHTAI